MPLSHGILQMIDCFTSRAKIHMILTTLCVTPYNNVEASRTKLICQMQESQPVTNPQNCSNNRTVVRINVLIRFLKVNSRARIESGPLYYRDICEGDWTVWLLTFLFGNKQAAGLISKKLQNNDVRRGMRDRIFQWYCRNRSKKHVHWFKKTKRQFKYYDLRTGIRIS